MFNNLFEYFGPTWAAAILVGIVCALFVGAAAETLRSALRYGGPPFAQAFAKLKLLLQR